MPDSIYLEDAKSFFRQNRKDDVYYEGNSSDVLHEFFDLISYVVPDRVTPEELIVFLKILYNDAKNGVCQFHGVEAYKRAFDRFKILGADRIDWLITYNPNYVCYFADPEFYAEFIEMFKTVFFSQEESKKEPEYGCIEVEKDYIDISNKDLSEVLAALYNHAKPIGMGIAQFDPTLMTKEEAAFILEQNGLSFGYLKGRPIKISFVENIIYVGRYNADNDQPGLAQKAISTCPNISGIVPKRTSKDN